MAPIVLVERTIIDMSSLTLYPAIGDVPRPGYYHIYEKISGEQFRAFYTKKKGIHEYRGKYNHQISDHYLMELDLRDIFKSLDCDFATCFYIWRKEGASENYYLFDIAIENKLLKPAELEKLFRKPQISNLAPLVDVRPIGFNSLIEYQEREVPPHVEGFIFKSASYMFKLHTFDLLKKNYN